ADALTDPVERFPFDRVQQRQERRFLAREVLVEGLRRDAGELCDPGIRELLIALAQDQIHDRDQSARPAPTAGEQSRRFRPQTRLGALAGVRAESSEQGGAAALAPVE